jgi:ABC-type tungstate transport system permease subunit
VQAGKEEKTISMQIISAGIDMALKVMARCDGDAVARATARHMEYPFPESNAQRIALT